MDLFGGPTMRRPRGRPRQRGRLWVAVALVAAAVGGAVVFLAFHRDMETAREALSRDIRCNHQKLDELAAKAMPPEHLIATAKP